MELTLKICEDGREWDNLLERCQFATIFHKWDFLKVMEKHSYMSLLGKHKASLFPLIGLEEGKPIGLFPIFYYNAPLLKSVFSPPLRSAITYLGPLLVTDEEKDQRRRESISFEFVRAVDNFINTRLKAQIIKIRTPPNVVDSRNFIWNNYKVIPLYNYEVNLLKGEDLLWGNFDAGLQKSIKKTSAKGMSVEEGKEEEFSILLSDVFKRYAEQGLDPECDMAYFFDIFRIFYPKNLKVFIVKQDGRYQTGSICLCYKEKVLAWVGSPKTSVKGIYPNDLLKWGCIKWAVKSGYKIFEISWANSRKLCNFKSKFDTETSIYFSCEKQSPYIGLIYSVKKLVKSKR